MQSQIILNKPIIKSDFLESIVELKNQLGIKNKYYYYIIHYLVVCNNLSIIIKGLHYLVGNKSVIL